MADRRGDRQKMTALGRNHLNSLSFIGGKTKEPKSLLETETFKQIVD